jgi:hypothetical protein
MISGISGAETTPADAEGSKPGHPVFAEKLQALSFSLIAWGIP